MSDQTPPADNSQIETDSLRLLEAVLFASPDPLSRRALVARLPDGADVDGLLGQLQTDYAQRGVSLVRAGDSWVFRTAPDLAARLTRETEVVRKLSRAAVETLAVVAYHQPVTRAEIEEIRGVAISRGTLDILLDAGWIRPRGRRRTPGRPMTWGTAEAFLHHFDLQSLDDLPGLGELKAAGLLDASPAIQAYRESDLLRTPEAGNDDADPEDDDEPLLDSDMDGPEDSR